MPPVSKKMLDKISEVEEPINKNNKIIGKIKGGLQAFKNQTKKEKEKEQDKSPISDEEHKMHLANLLIARKMSSNKLIKLHNRVQTNAIAEEDESLSSNSSIKKPKKE
jgi:ribosomal protein L24